MTDSHGRVTEVRSFLLKYALRILAPDDEATLATRFPNEWIVCTFCGESGWGVHPHFGTPCPIASSMAEAAGLKMDAERSTAIRAGVQMEEVARLIREQMEEGHE